IGAMLRTKEGKPRISIVSIAHLSERERMFVVTLLLGELVAWVRTQPGSSSLRALLYMDEVFGYFPPVANPPSKRPMLTLLKQARAHGLGVVLATQNPVDLDYKGLSNTGTWFLGRLQTERDKARVMEGLEGAGDGAEFDRDEMERLLAGLGQRVFLMHSVHEKKPTVFHTRWVMSYLRGPVTRAHIKTLMAEKRAAADSDDAGSEPPEAASDRGRVATSSRVPAGPAGVDVSFVDAEPPRDDATFRANVLGSGTLHFVRVAAGIDVWEDIRLIAPMDGDDAAWDSASKLGADTELLDEAPDGAVFAEPSAGLGSAKRFSAWRKAFIAHAYRHEARELWHCKALKTYSELGEGEEAFRERLASLAAEGRAEDERKVRARFARRLDAARERVRKAEARVERETAQYRQSGLQAVLSFVVTIIGALLGRKKVSATNARRAGSAVGRAGRTSKEKGDISRAKDSLEAARTRLSALEDDEAAALDAIAHGGELALTRIVVRPRKGDLSSAQSTLVWVADGVLDRS
ncbi:MAG: ATP-binding protein, partial [Planctomycetota bacterium]